MTSEGFKKNWWTNLLLYGLSLGVLLAALQYSRYRLLWLGKTEEWYIGLIAVMFAVVGIWAGFKWSHKRNLPVSPTQDRVRPKIEIMEEIGLTPRELEVLEQMAMGLSNQEIAEKLFVSLNTVKTHTSNLFSKLGVQRRTQAIQQAQKMGLIA